MIAIFIIMIAVTRRVSASSVGNSAVHLTAMSFAQSCGQSPY